MTAHFGDLKGKAGNLKGKAGHSPSVASPDQETPESQQGVLQLIGVASTGQALAATDDAKHVEAKSRSGILKPSISRLAGET